MTPIGWLNHNLWNSLKIIWLKVSEVALKSIHREHKLHNTIHSTALDTIDKKTSNMPLVWHQSNLDWEVWQTEKALWKASWDLMGEHDTKAQLCFQDMDYD